MFPQLPAAVRVFLCTRPTDMRKSFDGLLGMVDEFLGQDPLSGHLFLFLNRRRDRVKILFWEPDGLVIWYKRLEAGTLRVITIIESALIKLIDGNFGHEGSTGGLFSLPPGLTMRRWLLRRREATGCHHQRRIQWTSQPSRRQRSTAA
jgi:IS66 Orf2 like protein